MSEATTPSDIAYSIFGILWSLVLASSLAPNTPLHHLFALPAIRFFGTISFGLYLFHLPMLMITTDWLGMQGRAGFGVFLALSIGISCLTYLLIELPLSRIRRVASQHLRLPEHLDGDAKLIETV